MADSPDLRAAGERLEQLLEGLRQVTDGRVWAQIEEVVRLVTELYGTGLARILEMAEQAAGPADLVARMAGDELVGSLLVVHDLHPEETSPTIATLAHFGHAPAANPANAANAANAAAGPPPGPRVTPVRLTQKGAPAGAQP